MKTALVALTSLMLCPLLAGAQSRLDFTLHKLDSHRPGRVLLVVGGIQGDEPGGFNAAALLVKHYRIKNGAIWVVPNLNFPSIIKGSRGIYGDLNRKFASVADSDPELQTIEKIKSLILDPHVDLVLNLHDGSGFYRPEHIDDLHNPDRWGQSVIIDQERIDSKKFGNLGDIARHVVGVVNRSIGLEEHGYAVKNTETRMGNVEMAKTLTYFAIGHRRPAFGVEASKSFLTEERSLHHLQVLEAFLDVMGIAYERDFPLTVDGVKGAIEGRADLALFDKRIFLQVNNARPLIAQVPFNRASALAFTPSDPLMAMVPDGPIYDVYRGNRRLTQIAPAYFDYDSSIHRIRIEVDGVEQTVGFGELVGVGSCFRVLPQAGYRVNVIGYRKPGVGDESGLAIHRADMEDRFSIDRDSHMFRVEVYRDGKFTGMLLAEFGRRRDLVAVNSDRVTTSPPGDSTLR